MYVHMTCKHAHVSCTHTHTHTLKHIFLAGQAVRVYRVYNSHVRGMYHTYVHVLLSYVCFSDLPMTIVEYWDER